MILSISAADKHLDNEEYHQVYVTIIPVDHREILTPKEEDWPKSIHLVSITVMVNAFSVWFASSFDDEVGGVSV